VLRDVYVVGELLLALEANRPPVLDGYSAKETERANRQIVNAGFVDEGQVILRPGSPD
jgi:hypothetical protein